MKKFPWGTETNFREKILTGLEYPNWKRYTEASWKRIWDMRLQQKIHTFRESSNWLKFVGKELECFYWAGKPYRSKQEVFATVKLVSIQLANIEYSLFKRSDESKIIKHIHFFIDGKKIFEADAREKTIGNNVWYNGSTNIFLNDGLDSAEYFFRYFNKDWNGYILHFSNLKY